MKYIILFFFSFFILAANAQDGYAITGIVTDSASHAPVELANVILKARNTDSIVTATTTLADGTFGLSKVATGNYDLHVSFIGYLPEKIPVVLQANLQLGNLVLRANANSLAEATVVSQKALITKTSEKTVYNVAQSPTGQVGNAADVLRNMPGVSVDQKGNISIIGKQGVRVLVDGRPNAMAENNLQAFLISIPANSIESIEVITNPSARYDAEGGAGIINIKLKKGKADGLNANVSVGYGILNRYNANAALNYRKGKINVFGSYGMHYGKTQNRYLEKRQITVDDILTYYNLDAKFIERNFNNNVKAGFDYFASDKGTFTYTATGNFSQNSWTSKTNSDNHNSLNELMATYRSTNAEPAKNISVSNDLSYTHKIDTNGQEVSAGITHTYVKGSSMALLNSLGYDSTGAFDNAMSLARITESNSNIHNIISQLDYTYVFSKGAVKGHKIDVGLKDETTLNGNLFKAYRIDGTVATTDSLLSNSFNYTENIAALYLIYGGAYKEWLTWSAGLRGEHTYIKSNNNSVNRQYFSVFPSASLGFAINQQHNLSISYSRRVMRPQFRQLNNTVSYTDQYSTWQGNPLLQPSFSDILSISHSIMLKQHMIVFEAIGQLQSADFIESSRVDSNRITRGGNSNGSDRKMFAFNFYFKVQLTKWWELQMNHSYNYSYYSYARGINVTPIGGHNYNLWMSTNFKFWKNTVFEINGWFNTGGVQSQGKSLPVGVINASIKKTFLKDKLTVSIAGNNLAESMKWRWTVSNTNLSTAGSWHGLNRVVMLTIGYQFGAKTQPRREKEKNDRLGGGGGRG
ncbi:MAG TPA: outer membrane beta-barrel protein [Chitinophagales bacterium]|nr:outer membrane beta-barrel protein [Chitinophagales bacterium]